MVRLSFIKAVIILTSLVILTLIRLDEIEGPRGAEHDTLGLMNEWIGFVRL